MTKQSLPALLRLSHNWLAPRERAHLGRVEHAALALVLLANQWLLVGERRILGLGRAESGLCLGLDLLGG